MRDFLAQRGPASAAPPAPSSSPPSPSPTPSQHDRRRPRRPHRGRPRLYYWSNMVQRQFDIQALSTQIPDIERAAVEAHEYVTQLLERRKTTPGADLISTLLQAEEQGDKLSHDECVNLVLNVLAGGVDTTQSQLAHALLLFAAHPDQWRLLGQSARTVRQARRHRGDAHRADRPLHRQDRARGHRPPRRPLPGGHDRRGLRRTRQPRASTATPSTSPPPATASSSPSAPGRTSASAPTSPAPSWRKPSRSSPPGCRTSPWTASRSSAAWRESTTSSRCLISWTPTSRT